MTRKNPELRFKNFTNNWKKTTFKDTSKVRMCRRIFKNETSNEEEIPFYKIGTFGGKPDAFINRNLFNNYKNEYPYPEIGDVLISASGTIGRTVIYDGEEAYFQDSNIIWLEHYDNKITNRFLVPLLEMTRWNGVEGSTIKRLYNSAIYSTRIVIPSLKEQTQIGNFFKKIDELIQLQQATIYNIEEMKKGFINTLFPSKGSLKPRIILSGSNNSWNTKMLGELVSIATGKLNANAMSKNGEYDFYTSGISKYKIDTYSFVGPAITIAGNGATVGYMHLADGKFDAYQRTYVLNDIKADRLFLFYEIKNKLPRKIHEESRTGNIPYIVMNMVSDLSLKVPDFKTQKNLGLFMNHLDSLIDLENKELKLLQEMKKAFLHKMFV